MDGDCRLEDGQQDEDVDSRTVRMAKLEPEWMATVDSRMASRMRM